MTVKEYNKSVDLYSDHIFRFILKSINDTEKAKDIVQDCYEKLWVKVERVSFEKVKSYLFSAAYHTMIDTVRKENSRASYVQRSLQDSYHEDQYNDLNEILHQLIQQLPDAQRSVILLRDYEGYSYHEIAEITGLTESQVKVYIYRGRLFLKEKIGKVEVLL
jgi:RNA polymerase sigma-70 factor (ECF subfamily)